MSTLISMVGKQPSAVATTAKTLLEQAGLEHIFLLPTEGTREECGTLEGYLRDSLHIPAHDIERVVISHDGLRKGATPSAWDAIRQILDRPGLSQPVYFDVSPGLNYQAALLSHHLKDDDRFDALYADNRTLHNLTRPGAGWNLSHIGFGELLGLYGLKEKAGKAPTAPGEIVEDVEIIGSKIHLSLVCACERHGRFFGLYRIWASTGLQGPEQSREARRVKQEARLIESLEETPEKTKNLNPDVIVWTNNGRIVHRLRASGIRVIEQANDDAAEAAAKFMNKLSQKPGNIPPGDAQAENWLKGGPVSVENEQGQWNGGNLIVALGTDPSATLKAVFTHQPKELLVLVDEKTPTARGMAERMRKQSHNFGARVMEFWPVDMTGNIRKKNEFAARISEGNWSMNITPGTKAQSWRFARLPVATLWSLENKRQKAIPLAGSVEQTPLPFDFPPIVVQASVVGGPLAAEGISLTELREKQSFLACMGKVVSSRARQKRGWIDKGIIWKAGESISVDDSNYIKCLQVDAEKEMLEFEVRSGQCTKTGRIKSPSNTGHWFEEVVAGSILKAGGNDVRDIRVGIRWGWPNQRLDGRHFRNDLDIAVLWKGHYIGISCKTGFNLNDLDQILNEVIAVTRTGLGRFALPVVARGGIHPGEAKQVAEQTAAAEPLEIGMTLLDKEGDLNRIFVTLLSARRTLR